MKQTLNEADRIAAGLMRLRAKGPVMVALDVSGSSQRDVLRWASRDIAAALVSVGERAAHFVAFDSSVAALERNVALELMLDIALDRLLSVPAGAGTLISAPFKVRRMLGVRTVIVFSDCEFQDAPDRGALENTRVLFIKYPAQGPTPEYGLTVPYMR